MWSSAYLPDKSFAANHAMKILAILRHGEAEPFIGSGGDAQRALTNNGQLMSRAAGNTIKTLFDQHGGLEAIYHSPFLRTTETAAAVHEVLAGPSDQSCRIEATDALLGDNKVKRVCDWLDTVSEQRVLLVSHQPLVSYLLSYLLQGESGNAAGREHNHAFYPASLAALSTEFIGPGCASLIASHHHSI